MSATMFSATGEEERVDYVETYECLEDSYVPGATMPPVQTEWRFRYAEYYYDIQIESPKSMKRVQSYRKPIIRSGFLGIYLQDTAEWKFINVKEATQFRIIKYSVKVRYKLVKEVFNAETQKYGFEVAFKKDKPEAITGDEM